MVIKTTIITQENTTSFSTNGHQVLNLDLYNRGSIFEKQVKDLFWVIRLIYLRAGAGAGAGGWGLGGFTSRTRKETQYQTV